MRTIKPFLALLVACIATRAVALPGVTPQIPDTSGEYVYYGDSTFQRPSVIGFAYYDDATYALRYYAPAADSQPVTDITLYLSVDPALPYLSLTGERIIGAISAEDTEIVNYLHDLFYEFTARRQSVELDGFAKVDSQQEYPQFGGNVTLTYSPLVPIFNLESIRAPDGSFMLQLQTVGLLTDSADESFTQYTGVTGLPKDKKRTFKKPRAKAAAVSFEGQTLALDTAWEQSLENLWLLGDSALLTLNVIDVPDAYRDQEAFTQFLVRRLCQGTTGSYVLWPHQKVESSGARTSIMNVYYQPESQDVTRDFKVLTRLRDGTFAYLTLTVFDGVYQSNKKYFENILKSYKAE